MRSAKLVEAKKIAVYDNEPDPKAEAGQVLIRVKAVGICGTDIHVWHGERPDVALPRAKGPADQWLAGMGVSRGSCGP